MNVQPSVTMPAMSAEQTASWHGLMDLYDRVSTGWALIGGQLVHLHCAERESFPERATDDADTVVDIRTDPSILATFTQALKEMGFKPETSGDGLQHRWRRDKAQIDVLLPEGIGERAASRLGAGGAPTLPTPGGTQALQRAEAVTVRVDDCEGTVLRPSLVGALVIKAAAHGGTGDAARGRHRRDFVTLASLVSRTDFSDASINRKDRKRLSDMVKACLDDPTAMTIDGAEGYLRRVSLAADPQTR